MKYLSTMLLVIISSISLGLVPAGDKSKRVLPEATVKSLTGKKISTSTFENDGKPIIVSFWATWCKPCILELSAINDEYADWQEETGVKLIAISIDDVRNSRKVSPFVNGRGWDFDVYLDENGDFKRAMNVSDVPHTFLLNGNREIVWDHMAYAPGDEQKLYELVKKLNAGQNIEKH